MLLDLKDLSLEEAGANVAGKVGLENVLEELILAELDTPQRHHVDSLDALGALHTRSEPHA